MPVRSRLTTAVLAAAILAGAPATAGAYVSHTVTQGETLWSIAAASNLTTRTLAVFNGLPETANVVLGSTIRIPSIAEGAAALANAGATGTGAGAGHTHPHPPASAATVAPATPAGAPQPRGGYVVRPGDTLSGLAAQARVPVAQMAAMNGLAPDAHVIAGTVLKLPTGAPTPTGASQPLPAQRVVPAAAPAPAPGRLSGAEVSAIAAQHGAPGALAAAIGWQESGFNNAMVSSANARGIMQVMPGTWNWIQENLASGPLDPSSPADNVKAGSLYLAQLLRDTGGDPALAAAGYYQGLKSVRERGMYEDTKRYVQNVLALRARFGG